MEQALVVEVEGVKMKFKCKNCDEEEDFENKTEAREEGWHKEGKKWICDDCWEDENDNDDDDDEDDDGKN